MEIVPADEACDLTNLVGLRLPALGLEVHELGDVRSDKDAVAPSAADFFKAERDDEPDQVTEIDVADTSAAYALKQPRGLHSSKVPTRYDRTPGAVRSPGGLPT
jgi:hypothetical protein